MFPERDDIHDVDISKMLLVLLNSTSTGLTK